MNALISFIGRHERGYSRERYRFESGAIREATYFGHALLQELRAQAGANLDTWIIIGTPTSGWEQLDSCGMGSSSADGDVSRHCIALRGVLESGGRVTRDALGPLEQAVSKVVGIRVRLRCCEDDGDEIFTTLRDALEDSSSVALDVTHGFRTMPLHAIMALGALRWLKGASVSGIYYGAKGQLDETGCVPGRRLAVLSDIARATPALAALKLRGDVSALGVVLERLPGAGGVRDALDNTQRLEDLMQYSNSARPRGDALGKLRPAVAKAGESFLRTCGQTTLASLDSLNLGGGSEGHVARSKAALDNGDYLRAIALAYEALLLGVVEVHKLRDNLQGGIPSEGRTEYDVLSSRARETLRRICRGGRAPAPPRLLGVPSAEAALDRLRLCRHSTLHAGAEFIGGQPPQELINADALTALLNWAHEFHSRLCRAPGEIPDT